MKNQYNEIKNKQKVHFKVIYLIVKKISQICYKILS